MMAPPLKFASKKTRDPIRLKMNSSFFDAVHADATAPVDSAPAPDAAPSQPSSALSSAALLAERSADSSPDFFPASLSSGLCCSNSLAERNSESLLSSLSSSASSLYSPSIDCDTNSSLEQYWDSSRRLSKSSKRVGCRNGSWLRQRIVALAWVLVLCHVTMPSWAEERERRWINGRSEVIQGVNECEEGLHDCHKYARCINTRRAFKCKCERGFWGDGKECTDIDECEEGNGGCVHTCQNRPGNVTCTCKPGFQLDEGASNCVDIDECSAGANDCDRLRHDCVNTIGSYICQCKRGYHITDDQGTCRYGGSPCARCQHSCQNYGSRRCTCFKGYKLLLDGTSCVRTCAHGNGGCQHDCLDTAQGPKCFCHDKYVLNSDGQSCRPTCLVNNGGCERRCIDAKAGVRCACPRGFRLHSDGRACVDVDECARRNGGCSHYCTNNRGSFECHCDKGFKLASDEKTCRDLDECSLNSTCDHICTNSQGSYSCSCDPGFQLYGLSHCGDVNECSVHNGGCAHRCRNVAGSFFCECHAGFRLHPNGKDCMRADSCSGADEGLPAQAMLFCQRVSRHDHSCTVACAADAVFQASTADDAYSYTCGSAMVNQTGAACADSSRSSALTMKKSFKFETEACHLRPPSAKRRASAVKRTFDEAFAGKGSKKSPCPSACQVNYVSLRCGRQGRDRDGAKGKRGAKENFIVAEFEIQVIHPKRTAKCDERCMKKRTEKKLRRTIRTLRKSMNSEKFYVRLDGHDYEVARKAGLSSPRPTSNGRIAVTATSGSGVGGVESGEDGGADGVQGHCALGSINLNNQCVPCPAGTFFDKRARTCESCASGFYQPRAGQLACIACPPSSVKHGGGKAGAKNVSECGGQCRPGTFSENGFEPCRPCRSGTYQPEAGRTACVPCGRGVRTRGNGARSFHDCLVKEYCQPGHFYESNQGRCQRCPRGTYQPEMGKDFCLQCPGTTSTDFDGVSNVSLCKDFKCGGHQGKHIGHIQTPNYPGEYPNNVECKWTITPEPGRRILVIIPEMFLAAPEGEKSLDKLVMRKSSSPLSKLTHEFTTSMERPTAFTARSKKLWVQFKSDARNTAQGFSIPYVTYDVSYQGLIEDIVQDSRLYNSHHHKSILQDRKLLGALLDVIAQPYNYYKYANVSRTMFPSSFIRLLKTKVRRFFTRNRRR